MQRSEVKSTAKIRQNNQEGVLCHHIILLQQRIKTKPSLLFFPEFKKKNYFRLKLKHRLANYRK